ncbi:hypothetical protein ACIQMR_35225 [Streptomyces sp. NPDC091376]|uniref:hypothetical protein n=1 Tax=Streptomyces sp. NPDC091376 TaxID=3365994 RepID=UPI0038155D53
MPTSPGPLLQSLNELWQRLRERLPDLPSVRIAISPSPPSSDHGQERWTREEDETVSGLVVSADTLREGDEALLTCILHEAAHLLCWVRGKQDTATRGAYHNATYLTAAEEVGLIWPADKARVQGRGYPDPELTDELRDLYKDDLIALSEAIPQVLPHLVIPDTQKPSRPDRLTIECQCTPPRKLRISQTVLARGPITCGVCGQSFA